MSETYGDRDHYPVLTTVHIGKLEERKERESLYLAKQNGTYSHIYVRKKALN